MADLLQKEIWDELDTILSTPPENRDKKKIESIVVWFRNCIPIFDNLEDGE